MPAEKIVWPKTQARASLETRTDKACSRGEGQGGRRTKERTLGKSEVCAAAVLALKARSDISAGARTCAGGTFRHCLTRNRKAGLFSLDDITAS